MNLRKESREATLAAWKAKGPAVIKRPLRFIKARAGGYRLAEAQHAADAGQGHVVKHIARELARATA